MSGNKRYRPLKKWERIFIPICGVLFAIFTGLFAQLWLLSIQPEWVIQSFLLYLVAGSIVLLLMGLLVQRITGKKQIANLLEGILNSLPW